MLQRHVAQFCGVLAALLAVAACGGPSRAELPASVTAALASLTGECSGVQGTPRAEDAVQRADLNRDGHDDFVLYAGWITCEGAWSIYGDREKFLAAFAGDEQGVAAEAFTESVYDAKIERADGAATLWLTTAAERCGRPRAPTFAEESFCDRPIAWNSAAARFDYAPLGTVRMIQ